MVTFCSVSLTCFTSVLFHLHKIPQKTNLKNTADLLLPRASRSLLKRQVFLAFADDF